MTDKPRELERDIDRTRNEMDQTIDALSERLNVRHLGERAANAVMRRAPEPPEAGRAFYTRRPLLVGSVALAAGVGAGFLLSPPDTAGKDRSQGPGLMDRAKNSAMNTYHETVDKVKDKASEMQENTKHALQNRREHGETMTQEAREQAREHAIGMQQAARSTYQVAKEEARDVATEAKEGARHVKETAKREMETRDVTPKDAKERASQVREAGRD